MSECQQHSLEYESQKSEFDEIHIDGSSSWANKGSNKDGLSSRSWIFFGLVMLCVGLLAFPIASLVIALGINENRAGEDLDTRARIVQANAISIGLLLFSIVLFTYHGLTSLFGRDTLFTDNSSSSSSSSSSHSSSKRQPEDPSWGPGSDSNLQRSRNSVQYQFCCCSMCLCPLIPCEKSLCLVIHILYGIAALIAFTMSTFVLSEQRDDSIHGREKTALRLMLWLPVLLLGIIAIVVTVYIARGMWALYRHCTCCDHNRRQSTLPSSGSSGCSPGDRVATQIVQSNIIVDA